MVLSLFNMLARHFIIAKTRGLYIEVVHLLFDRQNRVRALHSPVVLRLVKTSCWHAFYLPAAYKADHASPPSRQPCCLMPCDH